MFIIRRLFLYTQHTVFYFASMECLAANAILLEMLAARHSLNALQNTIWCVQK